MIDGTQKVQLKDKATYPRVSKNADLILNLCSNIQKTTFYVDGKKMVTGKRIKVLIDNKPHIIVAEPEGYVSREEYIQPPYMNNSILSFTFMIGDRKTSVKGKVVDINIQGVDDGVRTTRQQDYKEAVLFAKKEAIERAGVKIKSASYVRNFVLEEDYIESQSEAILLPDYKIIDIGYDEDGVYHVVLIGKIRGNIGDVVNKLE